MVVKNLPVIYNLKDNKTLKHQNLQRRFVIFIAKRLLLFARELFLLFADFYAFFTVSRLRILYTFVIVFLFKTMKEKDAWR